MTWKIAIGSVDGIHINQHFGRCDRFLIYRMEPEGSYSIIEDRSYDRQAEAAGHDTHSMQNTAALLADCSLSWSATLDRERERCSTSGEFRLWRSRLRLNRR
ncbi:NifB/NifX family molybdenum-iron cluster-binding protein [Paenibacillus sp. FSL R10-2771]|uniref:NifB/NifX family molybdenum-iron cluster-binding protein n=1 Tax=Paenibacillus sp. FSL R10-2771 TaxID=2954693 RepID=UPI0030F6BCFA